MGTDQPKNSPILYSYLKKYQQDPTSKVFAPLAEAYRKAGLIKEAVEIAREGLQVHPGFVGGRVALARALFDQGDYEEVTIELRPVVENVPDNLVAQKLLGESYLMLSRPADALATFKILLYYQPNDTELAGLVSELEEQAYRDGAIVLQQDQSSPAEVYAIHPAGMSLGRREWIDRVQVLQSLLQRVERYRWSGA